ncbi:hypothetical protein [Candidatus Rhodobacter oscarellae]|uniref:hypothetical protein n=1 Tax=Candidatus Rhodobacter oscarellae TaxID=1675527 RepID=UPI001F1ABFE3|nr:hypothetical protein [Candidatus Rhodobacter lobularis]
MYISGISVAFTSRFSKIFLGTLVAVVLGGEPDEALAQQGPYASVNIGGVPMYCTSRFGQQVPIWIDPSVHGMIGLSTTGPNPSIQIDPIFFNQIPPLTAQFWFLHECAHQVVGGDETEADCFAVRNLRNLERFDISLRHIQRP